MHVIWVSNEESTPQEIDRNSGPFLQGAGVNKMSICNVNDPIPTGQGDIGAILLSPFEDGHYSDTPY